MTRQEFSQAVKMVEERTIPDNVDDSILYGCGLPGFKPVTVSLAAAAKFIAWHARCLNGQWDSEALNEMREVSRKKWLIV